MFYHKCQTFWTRNLFILSVPLLHYTNSSFMKQTVSNIKLPFDICVYRVSYQSTQSDQSLQSTLLTAKTQKIRLQTSCTGWSYSLMAENDYRNIFKAKTVKVNGYSQEIFCHFFFERETSFLTSYLYSMYLPLLTRGLLWRGRLCSLGSKFFLLE